MTEHEMLLRAREACAQVCERENRRGQATELRAGKMDVSLMVLCVRQALRDLDKPAPVDRDLADLRELFASEGEVGASYAREYREGNLDSRLPLDTFKRILAERAGG